MGGPSGEGRWKVEGEKGEGRREKGRDRWEGLESETCRVDEGQRLLMLRRGAHSGV
jgi:hypothetical protein